MSRRMRTLFFAGVVVANHGCGVADPAPVAGRDPTTAAYHTRMADDIGLRRQAKPGGRTRPHSNTFIRIATGEARSLTAVLEDLGATDSLIRAGALETLREVSLAMSADQRPRLVSELSALLHGRGTASGTGALRAFGVLCPADGWLKAVEGELPRLQDPTPLLPARDLLRRRAAAGDPECREVGVEAAP